MINSMTGYGRADTTIQGSKITIEIRSVNHRYLELMFKMPKDFYSLEDSIRKILQGYIKRGRVDIFVSLDLGESPNKKLNVEWDLVKQYIEAGNDLCQRFNFKGHLEVKDILTIPEIVNIRQEVLEVGNLQEELLIAVELASRNLLEMRATEGSHLEKDLLSRIQDMQEILQNIEVKSPLVVEEYRTKLHNRVTEWLAGLVDIDEARLLNEVAFFTDKASIAEEITRLRSHFQQFATILKQDEPVGRKLDFLIQEMNREVNTIGSKANNINLSQFVVELKSELEKLREQVQNVE